MSFHNCLDERKEVEDYIVTIGQFLASKTGDAGRTERVGTVPDSTFTRNQKKCLFV
jgi:hypothetical protein